jgi:hypothetical protein
MATPAMMRPKYCSVVTGTASGPMSTLLIEKSEVRSRHSTVAIVAHVALIRFVSQRSSTLNVTCMADANPCEVSTAVVGTPRGVRVRVSVGAH